MAEVADKIGELYTDSITAVGAPKIDTEAVRGNLTLARKYLPIVEAARSPGHSHVLTQTIRNYTQALVNFESTKASPRAEPFVVYLYGKPGTGKSVLASLLAATLARKLSGDSEDVYAPSSSSTEFFDGYTQQCVHYIDDIGQDPEGKDWRNIPNLVSTSPFIVPMASLEEKGRFYNSKVIIMTSNFEGPNPSATRCCAALERRLKLKIEVAGPEDGYMFNVEEALLPDGPSTKYFASDCPLLRCESFRLRVKNTTLRIRHIDDLVDHILGSIGKNFSNSMLFRHLIKPQNGPEIQPEATYPAPSGPLQPPSDFCPTSVVNPGYRPSVPTPLQTAVEENKPLSLLDSIWKWKKPIFATTAFASILASLSGLVYFILKIFQTRNNQQAAYTGMPFMKPRKAKEAVPEAPPRPLNTKPLRQHLHPGAPVFAKASVRIRTASMTGLSQSNGFFLFGRWVVCAAHCVKDATDVVVEDENSAYRPSKTVYAGELAALYCPKATEHRDLRRYVTGKVHKQGFLVAMFESGPGFLLANQVKYVQSDCPDITARETYHYSTPSYPGLCGSPLLLSHPSGLCLAGVHVAGVLGTTGYADPIAPILDAINAEVAEHQSLIRELPPPPRTPHIPRRSRLERSPAYGAFPVEKIPAPLSRNDPRLPEGVDVDTVAFSKQNRGDLDKPWKTLPAAVDLYFESCNFPKFRMLTMEEAINGTDKLDGLDMKQSAGYPWCLDRNRKQLFELDDRQKYVPIPELAEAVMECLRNPDYFYNTLLKDELRPTEKALAGKTRLIEAAPIHAIIAGRMLFGDLFGYMHERPGECGSAVGCDPDVHWTPFYHSFVGFDNVWALDYSCFDSTLPSCAFDLIAEKLADLIVLDPSLDIPSDTVLRYVKSISTSKHVFGNRSYLMIGGNPSGCVGTSIFNSMINNSVLLSALIAQPDFVPDAAGKNYRILTYGDDCLYATVPDIHPSRVKSFFDAHTTLIVTPATKSGDFPPTSSLHEVTFLKRYFVPDESQPRLIHPVIEPATYEQSVMWTRGGEFQDVVTSLCFLAHHAGPNNYAAWVQKVKAQCAKKACYPEFLPYSYLQYRWLQLVSA